MLDVCVPDHPVPRDASRVGRLSSIEDRIVDYEYSGIDEFNSPLLREVLKIASGRQTGCRFTKEEYESISLRSLAAMLLHDNANWTYELIAKAFGVHKGNIVRQVEKLREVLKEHESELGAILSDGT